MTICTKAGIAYEGEMNFRYENVLIDSPRDDEVLVRILGVGICHTDLVAKSGSVAYPLPAVLLPEHD